MSRRSRNDVGRPASPTVRRRGDLPTAPARLLQRPKRSPERDPRPLLGCLARPDGTCAIMCAEVGDRFGSRRCRHAGVPGSGPHRREGTARWAPPRVRTVEADLALQAGRDQLLSLLRNADVLIESHDPGALASLALDRAAIEAANPALVHASITAFGADGPKSDWAATVPLVGPRKRGLGQQGSRWASARRPRFQGAVALAVQGRSGVGHVPLRVVDGPTAGVPSHEVQGVNSAFRDPQLIHREHFRQVPHAAMGETWVEGPRLRLSRTPGHAGSPPTLGEHSWQVLTEVLGYDDARAGRLAAAGIIE